MQSDSAEIRIEQPQLAEACILKVLPFASLTEEQATAELAVPFAVTGRIDQPAQTDEYRFQGKKNQKIECQVIARAEYSLLDPVLSVHDANGKELKQADDIAKENLDAQTSLTLPADGMYTVRIQDRFAHGGFRYFYRVEVQETRPDFQLTVKEHEVRVDPAKATELTVTVARTDGFSEEIHLTVSGLPEGVVCEPATSLKEGDSAKAVTLKLTGQSVTGFQNPIAIVGNTDGGQSHLAESTAITAPGPRTAIWLTVPATPVPEAAAAEAKAKPATPDPAAAAK